MYKTKKEHAAKVNLKRQGFTGYPPTVPSKSRKQGRVTTDVVMLPGYLLIEVDLAHQDLSAIRSTPDCITFLRREVQPAAVPNQVMISIKEVEDVLYGRFTINQGHTPGSKSGLSERGLEGHTAKFLALDGKDRARVLLTLLNSEHEVKIPLSSLGQQISLSK